MDLITLIGITLASAMLILAFTMEGGHIGMLLKPTSIMIVFGGTIGATLAGASPDQIRSIPQSLKAILFQKLPEKQEVIEQMVWLAEKARREGLLFLENHLSEIPDPYLRKGLQLVIDGAEPEVVRSVMENEMFAIEERHRKSRELFEAAGGYAPTMGIIGTVMGLIHVLANLSNPETLGPAIAVAFTATLYGVASANVVFFPIGMRLKTISEQELMIKALMLEGVIALQAGNNPIIIRERLNAFVRPKKNQGDRKGERDVVAEKT
ncbi:flagellar motor protein [Desulforudis sp. 1088]|uniref:flagellar motor protein n=1 Tax=unclassified Candidatus Desulforudis TaxID=2635950 RepID=UPI003CE5BDC6